MDESEYAALFRLEENHWWFKSMRNVCHAVFEKWLNSRKRILDVGCGAGFGTKQLERYGCVVGIDVSSSAVRFSKQRGVVVVQGSVDALPFKDCVFDAVTCFEVLNHRRVDPVLAVKEIYRVCSGGALFFLRLSAFQWLYSQHDTAVHTTRRYTKRDVLALVRSTRFVPQKVSYVCCFAFPLIVLKRLLDRFRSGEWNSELDQTNYAGFFFFVLMRLEIFLLKKMNLPFGIQVLGLFKKNGSD